MDDNFKEIELLINKVLDLQYVVILDIRNKIEYVINNQIKDDKIIENILEDLLNLFQTDETLSLYKKLCRYYYEINPHLVIDYVYLYKEMYLDDEVKELKL